MATLSVTQHPSFVSVDAGATRIARYNHVGSWKPYIWPLIGPCGNVLRGAGRDHPHQCGLFLAYGGHDDGPTNIFSDWDEPPYGPCGKMLHQGFDVLAGGDGRARIVQRLLYVDGEGAAILTETRDLRFSVLAGGECLIDWRTTVPEPSEPGGGPFAISARVCDALRARDGERRGADGTWPLIDGGGVMAGATGQTSRGQRFAGERWIDYSGTCPEGPQGLALFDHPDNPGFPGAASASGYGPILLSHHHPGADGGAEVATFRFGVYVHRGDARGGAVDERYEHFCAEEWA